MQLRKAFNQDGVTDMTKNDILPAEARTSSSRSLNVMIFLHLRQKYKKIKNFQNFPKFEELQTKFLKS